MPLAIYEGMEIDGKRDMYTKLKTAIPPGLANLIILELTFLLLALYIGLAMWTGLSIDNTTGMELIFSVMLFLSAVRTGK